MLKIRWKYRNLTDLEYVFRDVHILRKLNMYLNELQKAARATREYKEGKVKILYEEKWDEKKRRGLEGLVKNFDYELDNEEGIGQLNHWYNVHISMLYNELCERRDTLFVFGEVEKEWGKSVQSLKIILYSRVRSIIYNALPYKVIMGLSKIFVGTKEFSLEKTINVISQRDV